MVLGCVIPGALAGDGGDPLGSRGVRVPVPAATGPDCKRAWVAASAYFAALP